ncbi:GGDEF domain-containing protein [Marinospirillum insulare]|uniref:diguanylate cyclase n=1 Tax=Marinospirillum insulare TaxID=217169 RepID=A0ABQ5ZTP8_9GAMM|nr:GGDEF domain-containing protein [Marinospirillum insulare]GLR63519.1 hypothetical protein GCM10007878_09540 [Marinospirillum insulare]
MDSQVLKDDQKITVAQKLRLRRSLMAVGAGFANSLVITIAWQFGYVFVSGELLFAYLAVSSIGYALFPWLILTKKNLNFSDPSMTSFQIGWQLIMILVCMYAAPGIRELLIVNFLLILLFSVFRYHPKQLPFVAAFLLSSYLLVILAQLMWSSAPIHWQYEVVTSLVFVLGLIGVSLLGVEISSLRVALKRRNEHLALLTAKNEQLAVTDDLTGLYNRRHLMRILRRQKSLSDRGGYQFSIGFIDLDFFKQVNDTYGHAAGDAALVAVAKEINRTLRDVDYVARIGGEEFVVVLSQTDYAEALRIAERLRADIAQLKIDLGEGQPTIALTASLGVATYRLTETLNDLIHRGDSAAYAAKSCGRNCIVGEKELPETEQYKNPLASSKLEDPDLVFPAIVD